MTSVGVVTDSTADLPAGLQQRYELGCVPLVVSWDGQTYRDKVDLSPAEFYRRLRTSKSLPRTGAPSLAAFEDVFREQLQRHQALVEVSLPSKLSGTLEVARRAAATVDPEHIEIVDSGSVSIAQAWLVETAARLAADGASLSDIVPRLEQLKPRLRVFALLDTLEFVQRGGRIGRAQALVGTLLNVKPILSIQDGEVAPVERVRTTSGALRRLVELVVGLGSIERLGVVDGAAEERATEVVERLGAHFPELTIDRGELGPVLGTHGGPGVVGVCVLLAG
jgi:fatty acid kinase fatty acid binding subunit